MRHVLVVTGDHSLPDPTKWDGGYADADLELHAEMRTALESLPGYEFEFASNHAELLDRLQHRPPEFVLNFCDTGLFNVATQELHLPAILESRGIPYSGAPPACMVLCYDKAIVRLVAQALGVPTPQECYLPPDLSLERVEPVYPALIKPALGDGSVGINSGAVVHSHAEAERQLAWFRSELPGRAALIQEFLPGNEYGLALVGNPGTGMTCLPPLEVDYSALPAELPRILAFESKTGPENPYGNVHIRAAAIPETLRNSMRQHAETLFERLQCRDYARFDFRTAADGQIKLMEVNPNPAWSAAGKLALMAGFAGIAYPQLLAMILDAAVQRFTAAAGGS